MSPAPMTQNAYVAAVIAVVQARGLTDPDALDRIRAEAVDVYQSRLANTFSGRPSGSVASN